MLGVGRADLRGLADHPAVGGSFTVVIGLCSMPGSVIGPGATTVNRYSPLPSSSLLSSGRDRRISRSVQCDVGSLGGEKPKPLIAAQTRGSYLLRPQMSGRVS